MRFLIFNGIVAAALYYLVTGGFDPAPGLEAVQPLRTAITGALSDGTPPPRAEVNVPPSAVAAAPPAPVESQARPAPAPQPVQVAATTPPVPAATPLPVEDLAPMEEIVVAVRPEPVPAPPAEAVRIEAGDENSRIRRADGLAGSAPISDADQDQPGFMTPRERLAELQRLSEEMELFFVEKTVR